jgi:hypothetical protein
MHYDDHVSLVTSLRSDEEGNLSFDFPEEIIEAVGWKEGDALSIEVFAGRVIFRKLAPS